MTFKDVFGRSISDDFSLVRVFVTPLLLVFNRVRQTHFGTQYTGGMPSFIFFDSKEALTWPGSITHVLITYANLAKYTQWIYNSRRNGLLLGPPAAHSSVGHRANGYCDRILGVPNSIYPSILSPSFALSGFHLQLFFIAACAKCERFRSSELSICTAC